MNSRDYVETLDNLYKNTSKGCWLTVEYDSLDTVWISSDDDNTHTIALLDYNGKAQNHNDALFIIEMKNNAKQLLDEIKFLRQRVLDLLKENTNEVNRRIAVTQELEELKANKSDTK